ncbi:DUF4176 domain-containing protein [Lactococcus ileimucosae]|uniref:DUF4176 domain-containing protein n=1 Tax=Lactococcus ileimucosae TaxID=2941329 RepID=UPI003515247F
MNKEILPIGTIIYLKEGSQKLMILNRGAITEQNNKTVTFDYSAAMYPVGLNPEQMFYFNQENIDKVVHMGYSDSEEERFQELYQEWLEKNPNLVKGNVNQEEQILNAEEETSQTFGF